MCNCVKELQGLKTLQTMRDLFPRKLYCYMSLSITSCVPNEAPRIPILTSTWPVAVLTLEVARVLPVAEILCYPAKVATLEGRSHSKLGLVARRCRVRFPDPLP
jgi:hypothetical protein